ncbi:MAG: hypothetical protein AMJ53_18630 [Gammaproteobacteria bacterium SG8_11]|nr:MAG: hypothetical protein AMJ53_18630 [Gammaproteobacteria bacterium SG8_11]
MGQFKIVFTFNYLPDPHAWIAEGIAEVGTYTDGPALRQGLERGVLVWDCLTQEQYGELHNFLSGTPLQFGNAKNGTLPEEDGSSLGTYDTVNARWHEPLGEARGNLRFNVRMPVSHITRS